MKLKNICAVSIAACAMSGFLTAQAVSYEVITTDSVTASSNSSSNTKRSDFGLSDRVYAFVTIKDIVDKQKAPKVLTVKWYRCEKMIRERSLNVVAPKSGFLGKDDGKGHHAWFWLQPSYFGSSEYRADIYEGNHLVGRAPFSIADASGKVRSCNGYVVLDDNAVFNFNKASLKDFRFNKSGSVTQMVDHLNQKFKRVDSIEVLGYTDEIGDATYNQSLSLARAQTLKSFLVGKGFDANTIQTTGMGEENPVVQCAERLPKTQRVACLAPNRRVEIRVDGIENK